MRWVGAGLVGALAALALMTASDASAVTCSAPPTLVVAPGQRVSVSITANCTGASSPLDYQINITHHPQHGYLESPVLAPGAQDYVAPSNYTGPDQFSYTGSRSAGAEPSAEVTQHIIVREGANGAPVCTAPTTTPTVRQGSSKVLFVSCRDPEGEAITLSVADPPAHGDVTVIDASSVRYTTTDPGGDDDFTVRASDGHDQSAPVEVRVRAVAAGFNTPPTCTANASFSVRAGESGGNPGLLCSDPDGDALTYRVTRPPTKGTLMLPSGVVFYDAPKTASGSDSFAFVASDGTAESAPVEDAVTILPRRVPQCETLNLSSEHVAYPNEDRLIRLHCTIGNDGPPVAITIDDGPAHGTLHADSSSSTTADYTYRPDPAYRGTDAFGWHGTGPEGLASTTQTFSLTVADRGGNADPNCFSGSENGGTVRLGTTKVLTYLCTAPEAGDHYEIEVVTPPAHGEIVATSFAAPNTARITYRPADGYDGLDSFQTRVIDGRGGVSPTRDSRIMVVRADYNRPPRCVANGAQITYGTTATLNGCGDSDGDAIIYSLPSQPSVGSAVVDPSGNGVLYTAPASGPPGFTAVPVMFVVTDALGASRTWTYTVNVGTSCYPCGGTPPTGGGGGGGGGNGAGAPPSSVTPPASPPPTDSAPVSPPAPAPAPAPTPVTVAMPEVPGLDLGEATARLTASSENGVVTVTGSRAVTVMTLRCEGGCNVMARPSFGKRKGTVQRLTVPAGRNGKVVLHVPAAVLKQLTASSRQKVTYAISVRHADGSVSRDTVTFALRLRR